MFLWPRLYFYKYFVVNFIVSWWIDIVFVMASTQKLIYLHFILSCFTIFVNNSSLKASLSKHQSINLSFGNERFYAYV